MIVAGTAMSVAVGTVIDNEPIKLDQNARYHYKTPMSIDSASKLLQPWKVLEEFVKPFELNG